MVLLRFVTIEDGPAAVMLEETAGCRYVPAEIEQAAGIEGLLMAEARIGLALERDGDDQPKLLHLHDESPPPSVPLFANSRHREFQELVLPIACIALQDAEDAMNGGRDAPGLWSHDFGRTTLVARDRRAGGARL